MPRRGQLFSDGIGGGISGLGDDSTAYDREKFPPQTNRITNYTGLRIGTIILDPDDPNKGFKIIVNKDPENETK